MYRVYLIINCSFFSILSQSHLFSYRWLIYQDPERFGFKYTKRYIRSKNLTLFLNFDNMI